MGHSLRLYVDETFRLGQELAVSSELAGRLSGVMRLREGAEVLVFNGIQGLWRSRLCVRGRKIYLQLEQAVGEQPIKIRDLTLYLPLIKPQKLASLVRGVVELGVDRLVPYKCEYGGGRYFWQQDRVETIIESALEQSERLRVPAIEQPMKFEEVMKQTGEQHPFFACLERERASEVPFLKILEKKGKHSQASILVGPEGGFSPQESEWLKNHEGIDVVSLGSYILRSETAAHTAVAVWHAYMDVHQF